MRTRATLSIVTVMSTFAAGPGGWTPAIEVRHEDSVCISYEARLDGPFLVIRAALAPGWHTFAMDNTRRAEEKLAGKQALSIDHPTDIIPGAGLEVIGPWYQSPPKDFSRPELRWFSWGFERQAVFAAKVRASGAAAARISIRGQACTEAVCKNIDVTIPFPLANAKRNAHASEINISHLVQVQARR